MPICSFACLQSEYDVCVIGAGPAGLATAFGCHDRGLKTLVLEAGNETPDPGKSAIGSAEIADPAAHSPVDVISCAALGGTSHWWGGRSVPLDPADFEPRKDGSLPGWPIRYDDLVPWWSKAAEFLGSAVIEDDAPGPFAHLKNHCARQSETWGPELNLATHHHRRLVAKDGPDILLESRVVGFGSEGAKITKARILANGTEHCAVARHFVFACGGLGVIRLLLNSERENPGIFGANKNVGVGYMGHLTGTIANLIPNDKRDVSEFRRLTGSGGVTRRRRITPACDTLIERSAPNITFWLESLDLSRRHLFSNGNQTGGNGVRNSVFHYASDIAMLLTGKLGISGYRNLIPSYDGGFSLFYHAEQYPNPDNRIGLSNFRDNFGQFNLSIEFSYSDSDVLSVKNGHELLDKDIQQAGAGKLDYLYSSDDCLSRIRKCASDGYHQIGGTPMAAEASDGVVDENCRIHGVENCWITSSSVFPSSGQANPTLTIVALACRLANHLKECQSA